MADQQVLEIMGKAIYELRSHPRRSPWEKCAMETRASYRARAQEILNALSSSGFGVHMEIRGKPVLSRNGAKKLLALATAAGRA